MRATLLGGALWLTTLFSGAAAVAATPVYGYRVVARIPHPVANFTEGFLYRDGKFYEGTGIEGRSAVIAEQVSDGKELQRVDLSAEYFGEGIVDWNSFLYEWTWQSHVCFVYDRATLHLVKQFTYNGEGWGMTHTSKEIVTSNGTHTLSFRNPETFQEVRTLDVHDGREPVEQLNELEYIHGEIYANVWHSDRIARISPRDGHVIAWIDLSGLLPVVEKVGPEAVLNGIAYDAQHDRLFVTGKQWPAIFEIRITGEKQPVKKRRAK